MSRESIGILMLGGAKRVSMARHFIEAAKALGVETRLFSYELSRYVPVSEVATVIEGLRWSDGALLSHLQKVIAQNDIDIVIPFVDGAVEVAARLGSTRCFVPGSDETLAASMFDKKIAAEIFERHSIEIPRTYRRGAPQFPLIAKPRHGSASKGIRIIRSSADFRSIFSDDYLIQEYVAESNEYTVDCYVSRSGEIISVVPRLRLETAGGEVTRSITVDNPKLEETSREILSTLGFKGAVTLQFLEDKSNGRLLLMEINPRLGGGAVCSIAAGANLPLFILKEALGIALHPVDDWHRGTEIARYLQEVVFSK